MATLVPPVNSNAPTVNRFGVPMPGGPGIGILMPKLKHRFRLRTYGFGVIGETQNTFTQQVVTAGRPNIQFNNTPLHSYNNITYIAQKPEWQTIEITLRDDISNLITSMVSAQVQKQMNHYTQSAAAAGVNYKFSMNIDTLDGTVNQGTNDSVLESWFLEGCYLEQVAYDSLDYGSSDAVMITLTVRYDNATQGNEANTQLYPSNFTSANSSSSNAGV
jgi:hypothetical protein